MFFSKNLVALYEKKYPLRVHIRHIDHPLWKRASQSVSEEGSVTVETAMVLPVLLCAFLAVILLGRVFLVYQETESALIETARQIAKQEALLSRQEKEGIGIWSASLLYEKNRQQGEDAGGLKVSYMNLTGSEYRKETKEIFLEADYRIEIPMFFFGTWNLPFHISVLQKAWNGYAPDSAGAGHSKSHVYITEHGTAYHRDSQCYHLHVTVNTVNDTDPFYNGETGYRPCEFCVESAQRKQTLFITEDGECFHEDPSCSGLTRTVHYVPMEEVGQRQPCETCSGSD